MSKKSHGQVRRAQVITTYGPGALIDLPKHAAIVGGLDAWPKTGSLDPIFEPRLSQKLETMTGVPAPELFAPPASSDDPRSTPLGIGVYRFPQWFVVQEANRSGEFDRSRRLVHRKALDDRGKFDGCVVVPTRFVRACPKGHVDDLKWQEFVHQADQQCTRTSQLWLDEIGTGGDLAQLIVRCECGMSRSLYEATTIDVNPLGTCQGCRPWLGQNSEEGCKLPSRLLIRTASNAYFPQVVSVLSLPDRASEVGAVVLELWDDLQIVSEPSELRLLKKKPRIADRLGPFHESEVIAAIEATKRGPEGTEKPVKQVELEAILGAIEGFGDDVPIDPNFHARRLPERVWRRSSRSHGIETVIQLHRLREVMALVGFTRFEAVTPDIQGEYESDVERAQIAIEPTWFPAVENRGEGLFLQLRAQAVAEWLDRAPVKKRVDLLATGFQIWADEKKSKRLFPGGPYVMLHTLSHLLLQSLAMRCGYPASSLRERVYVDTAAGRFGILIFTGSPDAEGTLGGLVQQARHIEDHLAQALRMSSLCSNDPVCAQHAPGASMEKRWLHGAACHGCVLVAETSCEMRNDFLDRALVVPTLDVTDAAFFPPLE